MSSDITDILARINRKLNNFTEEVSYAPPTIPKPYLYKYQERDSRELSIPLHNNNFEKFIAEENSLTEQSRQRMEQENLMMFSHVNEEEHLSLKNNKNYVEEQFRTSKSMERLGHHLPVNSLKPEQQEETFLSMKRKNKILEDNVKTLQNKLKAIEESLNKSKEPKQEKKSEPFFNQTFKPRQFPPTPNSVKSEKRLNITANNQYLPVQNNKASYQVEQNDNLKYNTPKSTESKIFKTPHKVPFKVSKNVIDKTFETKNSRKEQKNLRHVVSEANHYHNRSNEAVSRQRESEKKLSKNQSASRITSKYENNEEKPVQRCQSNQNSRNIEERESLRKKETNRNLGESIISSSFSQTYLKPVEYDNPNNLNKEKFGKSKPLNGSKLSKGGKKKFSKHLPC